TFGKVTGHPRLQVLDTTDPETVAAATKSLDLPATLFVVASKSGGTTETLSQFARFCDLVARKSKKPSHKCAPTAARGPSLQKWASERGFRWFFGRQPAIG